MSSLDANTVDDVVVVGGLEWTNKEKETENIEMGTDPQESFAKMNVDGNVDDGVGIETHQLQSIEMEEPMKEGTTGKIKATSEEGSNKYLVVFIDSLWNVSSFGGALVDHWLRR